MYLIKLGGSVITEKARTATFRSTIMDNLADQLAKSKKEFILVHGAGSFGHVLAKEYNLNAGFSNQEQLLGFAKTQAMVQSLNTHVVSSLQKKGLAAVSLPIHAMMSLHNHDLENERMKMFSSYLDQGFIPVTYGDVALDSKIGFSICSGDILMFALAKKFQPEKVIFVLDEDGIYDKNPKQHADASLIDIIKGDELDKLQTSIDSHADVTRGMAGKLQTIKKITALHIDTILINGLVSHRLYQVLTNRPTVQTIVRG